MREDACAATESSFFFFKPCREKCRIVVKSVVFFMVCMASREDGELESQFNLGYFSIIIGVKIRSWSLIFSGRFPAGSILHVLHAL